jgi:hypothetical protein
MDSTEPRRKARKQKYKSKRDPRTRQAPMWVTEDPSLGSVPSWRPTDRRPHAGTLCSICERGWLPADEAFVDGDRYAHGSCVRDLLRRERAADGCWGEF